MRLVLASSVAFGVLVGCQVGTSGLGSDGSDLPADGPGPVPDAAVDSTVSADSTVATDANMQDAVVVDGAMTDGGSPVTRMTCFRDSIPVTTTGGVAIAQTPHYEVRVEGPEADAVQFARMLEAAFPQAVEYFGRPPVQEGRFVVRVLADQQRFEAAMVEDGLSAVGGAGGFYSYSNHRSYLSYQPTRYYTRVLLVHEAMHQVHHRGGDFSSLPFWYGEGVAEYLGRHHWDGECITLGVLPLLTQEDTLATALQEVESGVQLADVVLGSQAGSRPVSQSIFRYFSSQGDARWQAFRGAVDLGENAATSFENMVGNPAELQGAWSQFVRSDQEPMHVIYIEWTHTGPRELLGKTEYFSIARVKGNVRSFETSFDAPTGETSAGVVVGYQDNQHWQAVVVGADGHLQRFEVNGSSRWNDLGVTVAPAAGRYRFRVEHDGGMARVMINDSMQSIVNPFGAVSGPALDHGELQFRDIRFEVAQGVARPLEIRAHSENVTGQGAPCGVHPVHDVNHPF